MICHATLMLHRENESWAIPGPLDHHIVVLGIVELDPKKGNDAATITRLNVDGIKTETDWLTEDEREEVEGALINAAERMAAHAEVA